MSWSPPGLSRAFPTAGPDTPASPLLPLPSPGQLAEALGGLSVGPVQDTFSAPPLLLPLLWSCSAEPAIDLVSLP